MRFAVAWTTRLRYGRILTRPFRAGSERKCPGCLCGGGSAKTYAIEQRSSSWSCRIASGSRPAPVLREFIAGFR